MILFRELAEVFQKLERTSSNTVLVGTLATFLSRLNPDEAKAAAYLVRGEVAAPFESLEIGIAERLAVRDVADAYATSERQVEKILATTGDLGATAQSLASGKRGGRSTILHVFGELQKIAQISGQRVATAKVCAIGAAAFTRIGHRSKIHPTHSSRHPSHWCRRHDLPARFGESLYRQH
jgi:DNA ligase-like protein